MLAKLFLQYILAAVLGVGADEGYATVYATRGDSLDGNVLACGGRRIPRDADVCAHRWLPCGTRIVVVNLERGRVSTCTVRDRGPYGVTRGTDRWRGLIDLTPGVARSVGLRGRNLVRIFYRLPAPDDGVWDKAWLLDHNRGRFRWRSPVL